MKVLYSTLMVLKSLMFKDLNVLETLKENTMMQYTAVWLAITLSIDTLRT